MKKQLPLTPSLLVAAAHSFVGLGEELSPEPDSPQGWLVECLLNEVYGPRCAEGAIKPGIAVPWDAAFVHHVGYWSHYRPEAARSTWPLPATGRVQELAQYAAVTGALREAPLAGDLFLLWSPATKQFVRTGVVAQVDRFAFFRPEELYYACVTIEGDSDLNPRQRAPQVLQRRRNFLPGLGDRFIRWTALDGREERRQAIERALERKARNAPRAA